MHMPFAEHLLTTPFYLARLFQSKFAVFSSRDSTVSAVSMMIDGSGHCPLERFLRSPAAAIKRHEQRSFVACETGMKNGPPSLFVWVFPLYLRCSLNNNVSFFLRSVLFFPRGPDQVTRFVQLVQIVFAVRCRFRSLLHSLFAHPALFDLS